MQLAYNGTNLNSVTKFEAPKPETRQGYSMVLILNLWFTSSMQSPDRPCHDGASTRHHCDDSFQPCLALNQKLHKPPMQFKPVKNNTTGTEVYYESRVSPQGLLVAPYTDTKTRQLFSNFDTR